MTYRLEDWLHNDLPLAAFDAVVAIECASHMVDRPRFFAEAHRVLRPGGRLVACVWLSGEAPRRWERRHLLAPIVREGRLAGKLLRDPRYRRFLLDPTQENRRFAGVLPRIYLAYWTGAIRYGVFTAHKPSANER